MPHPLITQADIETFQNEGVVLITVSYTHLRAHET